MAVRYGHCNDSLVSMLSELGNGGGNGPICWCCRVARRKQGESGEATRRSREGIGGAFALLFYSAGSEFEAARSRRRETTQYLCCYGLRKKNLTVGSRVSVEGEEAGGRGYTVSERKEGEGRGCRACWAKRPGAGPRGEREEEKRWAAPVGPEREGREFEPKGLILFKKFFSIFPGIL